MFCFNVILEAPGLDFGASGPGFWKVWGRFLEIFENFLACCLEDVPPVLPPAIPPAISPMSVDEPMCLKRRAFAESQNVCLESLGFHI